MNKDFFCENCKLQFDKKYVFDLHLSLVHGKQMIEVKPEPIDDEENVQGPEIFRKDSSKVHGHCRVSKVVAHHNKLFTQGSK